MARRRTNSVVAAVGIGLVLAGDVSAQPAEPAQPALEAFKEALDAAAAWTPPEGWVYRWRHEVLPAVSLDEIERREAQLANMPDHPDRRALENQRRLLESGPQASDIEVWWSAPGSFRMNSTADSGAALPYVDVVATPSTVFSLSPNGLAIVDPHTTPPVGREYAQTSGAEVLRVLRDFFVGGLGGSGFRNLVPYEASYEGTRLVGTLVSIEGASPARRCTIVLEPVGDGSHMAVREVTFRMDGGDERSSGLVFGNWVEDAALGSPIASSVEYVSTHDALRMRYTWLGARRMESGEFARVTRMPSIDSTDAVRGPVTFTSIMDFRRGEMSVADPTTGVMTSRPIPGVEQSPAGPKWLTAAGWTSAAALVGVRLWRSRGGSPKIKGGLS